MNDFESWLQQELKRLVASADCPSPRARQARYWHRNRSLPLTSKLTIVGIATGLALSGSVAASAARGGADPGGWAHSVEQALKRCANGWQPVFEDCLAKPTLFDRQQPNADHGASTVGSRVRTPPSPGAGGTAPAGQAPQDAEQAPVGSPSQPQPLISQSGQHRLDPAGPASSPRPTPNNQAGVASAARTSTPQPTDSPSPTQTP